ncbi:hypothetical protein ACFSTH_08280 [Paenibacillus yanchengensis]
MTIVYTNKKFPPPPFDKDVELMRYYRALYDGDHDEIFPRAKTVGADRRMKWRRKSYKEWEQTHETIQSNHPYIVANFSCLVAEVPADLVNRALGNISADTEEGPELEFVSNVVSVSKINDKIWAAVTQQQVDGFIAYRIRRNDQGKVWFEWLLGDRYLPHDDDQGADIAWIEEWGDESNKKRFLRVERQLLTNAGLSVQQLVYKMDSDNVTEELDIKQYAQEYEASVPEDIDLPGVTELLCGYVPNDDTLCNPRGRSSLRNIDVLQEEINWTITRDSIVFEKHGKPKLAIPRALWDTVANTNQKHYGARFVRNADLEVVSYDEKNGAVPLYITWDAKTEHSFSHVERLIKYMLAVSKTSPQAAGLEEGSGAKAAVAMLYEWMVSVIKAEAIQAKFDTALKDAIRKCMILENVLGSSQLEVKSPVVEWGDMLPKADSERDTEEIAKYEAGVQALETTVRRMHPDWSEEAIEEEMTKIEDEQTATRMNPTYSQPPKVTL